MKKTIIITILVLALIAAAVLGFQYSMHAKGNACVQSGAYEAAAEYYAKDYLFSKGMVEESLKLAGLDYLAKDQYKKAIKLLEEYGPELKDELCQAYCGLAQSMIATEPQEAMEIMNKQNPSANTQALVNTVRVEIAQYYLTNLAYDDALTAAETVTDPAFAGVQEIKNEVYYTKAMEALDAMFALEERDTIKTTACLQDILATLECCVDDPRTAPFTDLINPLLEGRYEEAVNPAFALAAEYPAYTTDQWLMIFREMMPYDAYANWQDQLVNQQRIFGMFGQRDDTLTGSNMKATITELVDAKGTACYAVTEFDLDIPNYGDVKTALNSVGSNPNGKILILREYWGERDGAPAGTSQKQKRLAVCGDLMNCMPEKYYPTNLDEVAYVILISYDYKVTGTYLGNMGRVISGYQENGFVTVYSMPGMNAIYNSGTQKGEKLGNRVTMSNNRVLSGGRPMLGSYVVTALETIEQKMN